MTGLFRIARQARVSHPRYRELHWRELFSLPTAVEGPQQLFDWNSEVRYQTFVILHVKAGRSRLLIYCRRLKERVEQTIGDSVTPRCPGQKKGTQLRPLFFFCFCSVLTIFPGSMPRPTFLTTRVKSRLLLNRLNKLEKHPES